MTHPTRADVEELLNDFEAHELIGPRRDVYEFVVRVFRGFLALEAENQTLKDDIKAMETGIAKKIEIYEAMIGELQETIEMKGDEVERWKGYAGYE